MTPQEPLEAAALMKAWAEAQIAGKPFEVEGTTDANAKAKEPTNG